MPQLLDILIPDAPKAEAIGDVVDGAQEPGKAVGERAVEVEDGEGVGHGGGFWSSLTNGIWRAIVRENSRTAMRHERIEINPAIMDGKPVIRGTHVRHRDLRT